MLGSNGTVLSDITPRAGPETVYNFEVAGEHVYYVGSDGLLVHNADKGAYLQNALQPSPAKTAKTPAKTAPKKTAKRVHAYEKHHPIPKFADGNKNRQKYVQLTVAQHRKLHRLIDAALRRRGFTKGTREGTRKLSAKTNQKKVLGAVAQGSRVFDKRNGTNVFETFISEIAKGNWKKNF